MYIKTPRKYLSTVLKYFFNNILTSTCTQVKEYLSVMLEYKVLKYCPAIEKMHCTVDKITYNPVA